MATGFDALAPWDAAAWFQSTARTVFTTTTNAIQIARADPQRIALIVSNGSGTIWVDTQPNSSQGMVNPTGMTVNSTIGPLVLLFAELGPMLQGEFWAATGGASITVTVYDIRLKDWPRQQRGRK